MADLPVLTGPGGRPLRLAHLTTVDMSLALLLETELAVDVEAGLETFGISAAGPYVPRIETLGVRHVPVASLTRSWDVRRDARAARELRATLRRLRLDILHTHNPKTGVLGRLLGRVARIPVVVNTCHGLWYGPDDPWLRKAFVLGTESAAATLSHAELYQNATDRHTLRRFVSARRGSVVGNGVDLTRFASDRSARARVRTELGIQPDELLVAAVGRQVAEKGIAEFQHAARRLLGKATFAWIGPPDPAKPDAFPADDAAVRALGERTDMAAVYQAIDVFVLPSYREGFSRSAMEAAASGVPMVLSDIRGCREIGTDGEHLLLVPPGDPDALVAAIDRLVRDPGLRLRLGAAARLRASRNFDQRGVARRSLETYAAVARRRGLGWHVNDVSSWRSR